MSPGLATGPSPSQMSVISSSAGGSPPGKSTSGLPASISPLSVAVLPSARLAAWRPGRARSLRVRLCRPRASHRQPQEPGRARSAVWRSAPNGGLAGLVEDDEIAIEVADAADHRVEVGRFEPGGQAVADWLARVSDRGAGLLTVYWLPPYAHELNPVEP